MLGSALITEPLTEAVSGKEGCVLGSALVIRAIVNGEFSQDEH